MKYTLDVVVTSIYRVDVEADNPEDAEADALDMEYDEMLHISSTVETVFLGETTE